MTVKELIDILEKLPKEALVVSLDTKEECYYKINSAKQLDYETATYWYPSTFNVVEIYGDNS